MGEAMEASPLRAGTYSRLGRCRLDNLTGWTPTSPSPVHPARLAPNGHRIGAFLFFSQPMDSTCAFPVAQEVRLGPLELAVSPAFDRSRRKRRAVDLPFRIVRISGTYDVLARAANLRIGSRCLSEAARTPGGKNFDRCQF
jgi:hypothetical protein